ncbi:MAG: hypothetical protein NDJ89_11775 [Oligoflexia bacterium]|nr:hypothetical protein [Oligoflexia bacterium]
MPERETPFLKRVRSVENPVPHLTGAAETIKRIIGIQRDLMLLDAEMKSARRARRLIQGVAGGGLLALSLLLGFFWILQGLHQAGWSPAALSLLAFAGFGIPGALLARAALATPATKGQSDVTPTAPLPRKSTPDARRRA